MNTPAQLFQTARRSFEQTRVLTPAERIRLLDNLQRLLLERTDDIVQTLCEEVGKTKEEALLSDIFPCLDAIKWHKRHFKKLCADEPVRLGLFFTGARAFIRRKPCGSVLVISPWNFPFQLAFLPVLAAVCAGNSVLLKPSELAEKTAAWIPSLFSQAGFPAGTVQVVTGGAQTVQELLQEHPARVFFTGSTQTGRKIAMSCAEKLIPCLLELGGKAPAIVRGDANLQRTAKGIAYGAFVNRGQVCVAVTRVLVHSSVYEKFLTLLAAETSQLKEGQDYGRFLMPERAETLKEWVQDALKSGARVTAGNPADPTHPLVLADVPAQTTLWQEEAFAPVLCVRAYETDEEAVTLANDSPYGLSATVWGSNHTQNEQLADKLLAGNISINDAVKSVGSAALPFGGIKDSGYGRYHGQDGFDFFSDKISVFVSNAKASFEPHWFPRPAGLYGDLRAVLDVFYGGKLPGIRFFKSLFRLGKGVKRD